MPDLSDETLIKIGITIAVVVMLVVPAVAFLLLLDFLNWLLRKRDKPKGRGFEVQPVSPTPRKP